MKVKVGQLREWSGRMRPLNGGRFIILSINPQHALEVRYRYENTTYEASWDIETIESNSIVIPNKQQQFISLYNKLR